MSKWSVDFIFMNLHFPIKLTLLCIKTHTISAQRTESRQSLIFPVALFLIFFFCVSSSFLPLRPPNFPAGITKFHLLLLNFICTVCVCVCVFSVCSQTRRRSHAVNCPCHPRVTSRVGNLNEHCVSACSRAQQRGL